MPLPSRHDSLVPGRDESYFHNILGQRRPEVPGKLSTWPKILLSNLLGWFTDMYFSSTKMQVL